MLRQPQLLSRPSAVAPLRLPFSILNHPHSLSFSSHNPPSPSTLRTFTSISMPCNSYSPRIQEASPSHPPIDHPLIDRFSAIATTDASGEVIRKYFGSHSKSSTKMIATVNYILGPVTIADRSAEEAMISVILENFPSQAIYGEENGWRCKESSADYVWVLDPIDGTKSFITGKPLFGTLIALLYKGKPILGMIDQPILRERWIGINGRKTTLNGEEVATRTCASLSQAYLYTTSPHLFNGDAEEAFTRVREKVKVPLYGCDCYAYALLASGFVDLVVESGLKPYDFLALIPVIEGAGGVITDWNGQELHWEASAQSQATSTYESRGFNVVAAGDGKVHDQALELLAWPR